MIQVFKELQSNFIGDDIAWAELPLRKPLQKRRKVRPVVDNAQCAAGIVAIRQDRQILRRYAFQRFLVEADILAALDKAALLHFRLVQQKANSRAG